MDISAILSGPSGALSTSGKWQTKHQLLKKIQVYDHIERKNHVTMKKVVEHFQSNQSGDLPAVQTLLWRWFHHLQITARQYKAVHSLFLYALTN